MKVPRSIKLLGNNSQKKYLGIFRAVFKQVADDDMIERNVVNDIELRNRQERNLNEVRPFSTEERLIFFLKLLKTLSMALTCMLI